MAPDDAPVRRRSATDAEARALASSVRLRILRLCYDAELTNRQLADRLGIDPGSALHHVRTLVDTGFLEALPERRGKRGARERPYRATGKSWSLDVQPTGAVTAAGVGAFLAEVGEADPGEVRWTRAALSLHPDDLSALEAEIEALADRYVARRREDGVPCAIFMSLYPRTPTA